MRGWASVSPFDTLRTPSPSRGTPTPFADVEIGDHLGRARVPPSRPAETRALHGGYTEYLLFTDPQGDMPS